METISGANEALTQGASPRITATQAEIEQAGTSARTDFVRDALDMSLDEVRSLLSLDLRSKADCDAACTTIDAHLQHVRERLQELQALERSLLDLRNGCDGTGAHCRIIEALHAQADAQPSGEPPRPGGPLRHV